MRRSLALSLGLLLLASTLAPASTLAASAWTVSLSGSHVQANIVGDTGGTDATLALYNETSITPFGSAIAAAILTALGLGGGYSQEARWPAGNNPAVGCPGGLVDLPFTCRAADRTLLIPGPIQASLTAHAASPGSVSLSVAPDGVSLGYDVSVAAVGIALETLVGGSLIGASATEVGDLAWQLTPDAAGAVAALLRHDDAGALQEILALAKQALQVIIAHAAAWSIGAAANLVPGALEVKLAIAVAKASPVFINLAATLLGGNAGTEVALAYGGPAEAGLATGAPLPTAVAPGTLVPTAPPRTATPTRRPSTPKPPAHSGSLPEVTQVCVSYSGAAGDQAVTFSIRGVGMGTHAPYVGDTSFLLIADLTGTWDAGYERDLPPDQVTLDVSSWTDTTIVARYAGAYSQWGWIAHPDDTMKISVWNPGTAVGPATLQFPMPVGNACAAGS